MACPLTHTCRIDDNKMEHTHTMCFRAACVVHLCECFRTFRTDLHTIEWEKVFGSPYIICMNRQINLHMLCASIHRMPQWSLSRAYVQCVSCNRLSVISIINHIDGNVEKAPDSFCAQFNRVSTPLFIISTFNAAYKNTPKTVNWRRKTPDEISPDPADIPCGWSH